MARGRRTSFKICLTPAERRTLLTWQRDTTVSAGLARRLTPTLPAAPPRFTGAVPGQLR